MDIERRSFGEIRASGRTLHGIAAPFGVRAQIGDFSERIAPGAFAASLASGASIRALADHQPTHLLGTTRSGTLQLTETSAGLEYRLDVPPTMLGNDLLTLATRGDLAGVSIGFVAEREAWPSPSERVLQAVTLHEISIISGGTPAYADTSIAVRHRSAAHGDGLAQLHRLRLLVL